jgi:hypothetical protein
MKGLSETTEEVNLSVSFSSESDAIHDRFYKLMLIPRTVSVFTDSLTVQRRRFSARTFQRKDVSAYLFYVICHIGIPVLIDSF